MLQTPSENRDKQSDFQTNLNVLLFVIRALATSVEVFLHRDMGPRYLGFNAIAVLVFIPVYCAFWEGYNLEPMMWFLVAYVVMLLVTRLSVIRQRFRGEVGHSFYNGFPRLLTPKARVDEVSFKRHHEPIFVGLMGLFVSVINPPLGWFWMFGAAALILKGFISDQTNEVRVMDLRDAMIEQQILSDKFRSRNPNRF